MTHLTWIIECNLFIFCRNFPSQRDDFDIIMDHDKEKHNQIKQKLLSFVNVNLGMDIIVNGTYSF